MHVYRHDLFVKYNETWPTSWAEFERICEKITRGEWAEGTPFWCLDWGIGTRDTNRFATYFAMMASVDGGQDVVLPGGIPNVNSPQVRKALITMKRWINSDIMYPSPETLAAYRAAGHNPYFWAGNVLVRQEWTDRITNVATEQIKHNSPPHCIFKIGGGLGTEKPVDGSWHLGVNKAMRHKATGMAFLSELAPYLYNITLHYKKYVPLMHGIWENPQRRAEWCQHVPEYCEAYDKYREYHTSLSYRPSKGCGALYNECVQLIAQHFMNGYVHGTVPLEQAIADLEAGLGKLLGTLEVSVTTEASEDAKSSKIIMIIAVCVVGVLLVLVAVYVWFSLKKLRKVGIKVPVAAMLGLVTAISLTVVAVIILTTTDSSARSISEDLALRARVTALQSVQVAAADQRMNDPLYSINHRTRIFLSLLMNWVSGLDMDKGALIMAMSYDRTTKLVQVMLSTDNSVQKEHVFLPINAPVNGLKVSPLLNAFLKEFAPHLVSFSEADTKKQMIISADEKYYANVKTVGVTGTIHCAYFVPVSTVMGEATDSLNAARNYGVIASLIAVLVVTVFATLITRPLIDVSHHMEKARVMEFDSPYAPGSFLSETRALQEGFRSMAELLVQYKTFLPQSIFVSDDDDDEDESATDDVSTSQPRSNAPKSSVMSATKSSGSASHSKHGMQVAMISAVADLTTLKETKGSIVLISIENMAALATGVKFTEFFESVEEMIIGTQGALHIFNSATPGKMAVSFGLTRARAPSVCCEKAVALAFNIINSKLVASKTVLVSVTVHQGRMKAGNLGSVNTRGFGMVGKGVVEALYAEQYASDLVRASQTSVVICTALANDMTAGKTKARPVTILSMPDKSKVLVTQLQELLTVAEDEWMYELEEAEKRKDKGSKLLTTVFLALREGKTNLNELMQEMQNTPFDEGDTVGLEVGAQLKSVVANGQPGVFAVKRAYTWVQDGS